MKTTIVSLILLLCSFVESYSCTQSILITGPSRACPGATYQFSESWGNLEPTYLKWECTNCLIWNPITSTWVTVLETSLQNPGYVIENVDIKMNTGQQSASVYIYGMNANTWDDDTKQVTLGPPPGVTAATLSGSNYLESCHSITNTYTLGNIASGWSLNDWIAQSPLQTSNETSTSVKVSSSDATGYGTSALTAQMVYKEQGFSCGTQNITKNIYYGKPSYHSKTVDGNPYTTGYQLCPGPGNHWVGIQWYGQVNSYSWSVQSGITYFPSLNECDFTLPTGVSSVWLTASATNNCGSSSNASFYLSTCSGGYMLTIYPNPASDEINIEVSMNDTIPSSNKINSLNFTESQTKTAEEIYPNFDLKLFDDQNNLIYQIEDAQSPLQLGNLHLKKGLYIVNVLIDENLMKEKIIIE